METVYHDYSPRGVQFYYVYKALAHPETNGYVKPYTLAERLLHVREAERRLGSKITWLCDTMANDLKHALGNAPNSEYIMDRDGKVVVRRLWSDPAQLRQDLAKRVGAGTPPTPVSALNLNMVPPPKVAASGVVPRLRVAGPTKPLKIHPATSAIPYYAKLRAEVDQAYLKSRTGKLYLGFRMDPIYRVHWNNLTAPPHYEITCPEGVTVAPAAGDGPKVKEPADIDPREFLLDISGRNDTAPLRLVVRYFACNDDEGWCRPVTQEYTIDLQVDPDGGWASARHRRAARPATRRGGSSGSARQGPRRFGSSGPAERPSSNDLAPNAPADGDCTVTQSPYGTLPDGSQISCFTLSNGRRMRATVINYGATITGVFVPDASGTIDNVVLHLDSLDDYLRGHPLFGSLVGRYANRIANAAFTIDGTRYEVTRNADQNHIHGGRLGFQKIVWKARVLPDRQRAAVEFTHTSPDGHEGYPGRLNVRVVYALTAANELVLEYFARTDKPTHVNLTNHAYWNLAGAGSGDVLGHRMRINADRSLVASESRFPTGEIRSVLGTPLDFTTVHPIGARIEQVTGSNYDDCYVLNKKAPGKLTLAARVLEPQSGRVMEVSTTQPGVQFYTAKGLSKKYRADGHPYGPYYGFCLETQHFPDAPNHSQFPSTLLRPGQTYHEMTVYRFATLRER